MTISKTGEGTGKMMDYSDLFSTPWYSYREEIRKLVFESGVTSIGRYAFYGLTALTSIPIPNSVKVIEQGAFSGCSGLTSVIIPNSVIAIGRSAFQYCTDLTSAIIGDGVTTIHRYAFFGCSGLTSVTIGKSVTLITDEAFESCINLTSVTVKSSEPAKIYSRSFANRYRATLYVPMGSKATYAHRTIWSEFKEIVEIEMDGVEEVKGDVDGNGKVEESDRALLVKIIMGEVNPDEATRKRADVNNDTHVNAADLVVLTAILNE